MGWGGEVSPQRGYFGFASIRRAPLVGFRKGFGLKHAPWRTDSRRWECGVVGREYGWR